MAQPRLIIAIGRIERALSRIEQIPQPRMIDGNDDLLLAKHESLKSETMAAIADLDQLISGLAM